MPEFLEESSELEYITPTSYESLRLCSLRKAFSQHASGTAPSLTSFAALGIASHGAIEHLVKTDTLLDPAWENHLVEAWDIQIRKLAPQVGGPPPDLWPRYNLTKARLGLAVSRLRALVQSAGDGVEVTSEVPLSASEGSLRGRADLVIRGSSHQVIDIKTGSATDQRSGDLLSSYRRQLFLYSYMEAESSGWPSTAGVLSLQDTDLMILVDPKEATQVAETALQSLQNYNRMVPGRQPAHVSAESCGYCPYAARCGPFWDAAAGLPGVISVAGTISSRSQAALGTLNLRIEASGGLLGGTNIVIQGIQPDSSSLASATTGSVVWVVGLWADPARGTYHIRDTASVALS